MIVNGWVLCYTVTGLLMTNNLIHVTKSDLKVPNLRCNDKAMIASDGDIKFGFSTPVHFSSDNMRSCDIVRMVSCTTALVSLKFALRDLNRRTDILPNITVGFVAIDDCGTPIRALEASTYFVNAKSANDTIGCNSNFSVSFSPDGQNVVAVVGPVNSDSASVAASFLSMFQIPLIATEATSDLLSDKTIYEYFLRLVSPDIFQVRALLDLCQHLGWTYVSLVYSEGSYGENAASKLDYFLRASSSNYSICLATSQKVYADATAEDINHIVSILLEFEHTNVVILFLTGTHQFSFLDSAKQVAGIGRFLWLMGDFFMSNYANTPYEDLVDGAIFIDHSATEMPDFVEYMKTIDPANADGDLWLADFWEATQKCSLNDPSNKTGNKCQEPIILTPEVCPFSWAITNRIYDAVNVIGNAVHRLLINHCPQAFKEKWMLKDCITGPALLSYIQATDLVGIIGRIRFDDAGNMQENLLIYQYQKLMTGYTPVLIGEWSPADGPVGFDAKSVSWNMFTRRYNAMDVDSDSLTSVCSLPCKGNEYLIKGDVSCCWTCRQCRNNEIAVDNQTVCQSCPLFYWPDENGTSCNLIEPTYLHPSHPISVCLLVLAALGGTLDLTVMTTYVAKRRHKLVMATNVPLSMIILFGILIVASTVVVFVIPPDESGVCTIRSFGFHCGINLMYAPLSVKNVLTYRIFTSGALDNIRLKSKKLQIILTASAFVIQVRTFTLRRIESPSSRFT
jgi:hypothetical protein